MSLKLRLSLLLGLLLAAFLFSLFALRRFEAQQSRELMTNAKQGRIELLNGWLGLMDQPLRRFADDFSQWEKMVEYVRHPDPKWAAANIDANLVNFDAQAAWVLRPDGTVIHAANSLHWAKLRYPPVPVDGLLRLFHRTPLIHFFALGPGGLFEFCGAPIRPPTTKPHGRSTALGWFLVARLWDSRQVSTLERLTESSVTLAEPTAQSARPATDASTIHLIRPLIDWRGRTIRLLRIDHRSPELAQVRQTNSFGAWLFGAFGLLVIAILAVGLRQWVLRPLGWISGSLASGTTRSLDPLLKEGQKTELGRVARMVQSTFAQRGQLEHEIRERTHVELALRRSEAALRSTLDEQARLGRDLHDGVIQSLYATGMGLVGIRSQIRSDPAEAELKLDQAREALNETIRDVRNFIVGLEPEAANRQPFTRAVERLVEFTQAMHPFEASVEIDEASANALSLEQRAHALQIAREAVSNALRHGRATRLALTLRRHASRIEFSIEDNGCGFDPSGTENHGYGLRNLAERARELDAELTVSSQAGKGTHVKLTFPDAT